LVVFLCVCIRKCRRRRAIRHHAFHNPIVRINQAPSHPYVRPVDREYNPSPYPEGQPAQATASPDDSSLPGAAALPMQEDYYNDEIGKKCVFVFVFF
jgi:hypothetical protein